MILISHLLVYARQPLEVIKKKIADNLQELEKLGVISHRDNYQTLVNSIVQVHTGAALLDYIMMSGHNVLVGFVSIFKMQVILCCIK